MSPLRIDRSQRDDDPFLVWKVRIFAVGATLGLAGIFLDERILVWAAIAVLSTGFAMRFAARRAASAREADPVDPIPDSAGLDPDSEG